MLIQKDKIKRDKALDDIWVFADLIDFRGGRSTFSNFHIEFGYYVSLFQKTQIRDDARWIGLLPRDHRKSTIGSSLYSLWRIYRNPNIRILLGANIKRLSQGFIRELRQYFEDGELQETVWNNRPHIEGSLVPMLDASTRRRRNEMRQTTDEETEAADKKVIWSTNALQVVRPGKFKEPTVVATSAGTKVTGDHYDLLLLDDIVDFDNSKTLVKAANVIDWAADTESVVSRPYVSKDPFLEKLGDEVGILGTLYYKHDYYATLLGGSPEERAYTLQEKGYRLHERNIYYNGVDNSDGYLFPESFNEEVERKLRARLKPRKFASQYLNKILADEDVIINGDKVNYLTPDALEVLGDGMCRIKVRPNLVKLVRLSFCIDPAISMQTKDRFAIGVGGYDDELNFFLVSLHAGKLTPTQQTTQVAEIAEKFSLHKVHCDVVGVGAYLPHNIREHFLKTAKLGTLVKPLYVAPFRGKGEKKERITQYWEPVIQDGRFYTFGWCLKQTPLGEEMQFHPSETMTDDCLDVCQMLMEVSRPTEQTVRTAAGQQTAGRHTQINHVYGGTR